VLVVAAVAVPEAVVAAAVVAVAVAEVVEAAVVAEVEAALDVEQGVGVEVVEVAVVRVAWALQQGDKRVYHKSPRLRVHRWELPDLH